jgi:Type VI secretion system (T6SS), amidase effector protein 4
MNRRVLLRHGVAASLSTLAASSAIRACNPLRVESEAPDRNALARPTSAAFWNAYLNYDKYTQKAVWKTIGGNIGEVHGPKDDNSCAARVSYGLNYGGAAVQPFDDAASMNFADHKYEGKAGDGKRYIVSAMQMAAYLQQVWGNPDHKLTKRDEIAKLVNELGSKCAIFATPNPPQGHGHSGVLKAGYSDPYVDTELPVNVWVLP